MTAYYQRRIVMKTMTLFNVGREIRTGTNTVLLVQIKIWQFTPLLHLVKGLLASPMGCLMRGEHGSLHTV
jgi:hypothetical protein